MDKYAQVVFWIAKDVIFECVKDAVYMDYVKYVSKNQQSSIFVQSAASFKKRKNTEYVSCVKLHLVHRVLQMILPNAIFHILKYVKIV
jgi:hypothetical protein